MTAASRDAGADPPGSSGVRRRHSVHHDDGGGGDGAAGAGAGDVPSSPVVTRPPASIISRRRSTGHSSAIDDISSSSAIDTGLPIPTPSSDAPRVRFSTEVDRHIPPQPMRRNSSGLSYGRTSEDGVASSKRPWTPSLSINTRAGSVSTLPRLETVQSANSATSPPSAAAAAATSPLSPRSRARGYSLRRSLFHRNVEGQGQVSPGSIIELQETSGSSTNLSRQSTTTTTTTGGGRNKKNDNNVTVTVSPTTFEYPSPPSSLPSLPHPAKDPSMAKGLKGISALPNYETWIKERAERNRMIQQIKTTYSNVRKFVLRINEIPPSKDGRHLDLDASRKKALLDERTSKPFLGNTIRSSRYTAWNFLPRQLWAQFSKLANFYFLCVSILQMIPGLSTTGTYTTIVPLLFFVSLSMAKEGYDDLRRYRLDKAENNQDAKVLHAYQPTTTASPVDENDSDAKGTAVAPCHWAPTKWKDIRVGDVIKVDRNEAVPADIVLLYSSGANGIAYIETMALDGETNLKSKQTTASLAKVCTSTESIAACRAHFVVEDPNLDLYNFEGRVTVDGQTAPLTNTEIVYRGSILRNTAEAIGMVIYTGEECKIRMNANKNPRIKAPALQSIVNKIVITIVIFVIALAIFNTVAYQIWGGTTEDKAWYLTNAEVAFFPILASFIIMFNTMIPLSLYVSLEIVKLAQMFLLNDIDMYDPVSDTPFEARTSTINEELGQISYIFSDKTGTLTDNSMKFRKLSVAGVAWLHDLDLLKEKDASRRLLHKKRNKGKKAAKKGRPSESPSLKAPLTTPDPNEEETVPQAEAAAAEGQTATKWKSSARPKKNQPELLTRDMIKYIQRRPYTRFAAKARLFLLSVALCHTCLPETQEDGEVDFQASSPDELALVRAAQELGYMVINRDVSTITLNIVPPGGDVEPVVEVYEVLDVIEFSSRRKRMSVVVRFPDQRICILCKGADTIVMQRLKFATLANKKVVEIERRASKRKSLEAHYAIQRQSEQLERRSSMARPSVSLSRKSINVGRTSISIGRPSINLGRASISVARTSINMGRTSISGIGRPSMTGQKLQPIRDELDNWLREREHDVDVSSLEDSVYYSPRPSTQLGRHSLAASEARSSFQMEELEDLVDESLVMDDSAVIERCFQHINDFATEGLRTLLYGYRFMEEDEYWTWKKIYLDATTSLVDRTNLIEKAGEMVEQDLELAGATAIEDKLQKGVPEAIDKLRRANIKMWMLTGDKRETAINIGQSCRLIKDYSSVTVLDHEIGQVEQHIAAAIVSINSGTVAHSVVVVDGQTLALITSDPSLESLFFDLAVMSDSVVCCRASPSQKASLVKAIRKKVKTITLAIGDGANDIAMIQEAHVGIGITGKEGLQAARTSDYSIAQFRFLTKLLLVHGRWNYIRTCKYTIGTFWKEMLFYLTQALYQRWAGYTGTSLYESWSLSMFNTLFTSLPVIFMGIFEKDLAASTLLAVPELYTKGQENGGFNFKIYLGWMFMASSEAMVVYFCMFGLFGNAEFTLDNGLFAMGAITFSACIILITAKMQLIEMHNKSIVAAISAFCSIGGWFLWNIILSQVYKQNVIYNVKDGLFDRFGRNALWWLVLILIVVSTLIFEIGVSTARGVFFTTDTDVFQELEKDPIIKRRFEEAASTELQLGWDRGKKRSSTEIEREAAEQKAREIEMQEILLNRPDVLDEQQHKAKTEQDSRRSLEIQEMLSKRFGTIRRE